MTVLDWLLDSDPSIRWQVMRDLADFPVVVDGQRRGPAEPVEHASRPPGAEMGGWKRMSAKRVAAKPKLVRATRPTRWQLATWIRQADTLPGWVP